MHTSNCLLATLKEVPTDAEIVSHRLMLRAGLIRRVAAGIYNWLPLGVRVLRKVEKIVREEMDRAGAQEVLMPGVHPAELWQQSGRWEKYGPELLRLKDRHGRDFCLSPTHEEVITALVKNEVRSYRQLPANFYQIQTKFRDEIRPRFGIMRGREFIMKDAYSFNIDQASLIESYDLMYRTYVAIFDRLGLNYRAVAADNGSIGGEGSHEFHVLADSGEDAIVFSDTGTYAANLEKAETLPPAPRPAPSEQMRLVDTPNTKTIKALVEGFNLPIDKTIKTLIVHAAEGSQHKLVALLVRGDHALNAVKAAKHPLVAGPLKMAEQAEIRAAIGAGIGSLGPVNMPMPIIVDREVAAIADFGAGANIEDKHYFGINWERDLPLGDVVDIRNIVEGDPSPDGDGTLSIARGIEVGHIFQLGTMYSEAMDATVLDENGNSVPISMGCYGIGITRIIAAAIEQNHDDKGIIWPPSIAPYDVAIVPIGFNQSARVQKIATEIHDQLTQAGLEVLLDDRNERAGVMFADMELIGIGHRIVFGERNLDAGVVEYRNRASGEEKQIAIAQLVTEILAMQSAVAPV